MNLSKPLGWLMLALAASRALTAADLSDPSGYRYGVRILSAWPRQDFREALPKTGSGAGVFVENDLGAGTTAQTRFDFIRYPQADRSDTRGLPDAPGAGSILALLANSASIGLDLRHPLPVPGLQRVHALAGVMAIRYEFDASYAGTRVDQNGIPIPGIIRAKDKTSLRIGLAVGLGLDLWRGLALAGRYTTLNIDGFTFGTLETSLSYRF